MLPLLFVLALFAAVVRPTNDAVGISEKISDAACIHKSYATAFPRGYMATGMLDPNYVSNTVLLEKQKFVWWPYMIPCFKCGNAAKQVRTLIAAADIPNNLVTVFIDAGREWSKDVETNRKFVLELLTEIINEQHVPILQTSKYSFEKVFGEGWSELSSVSLYYISPDGKKNCKDFTTFGGWTTADAKVYLSDSLVCGNKLDMIVMCSSEKEEEFRTTVADE